MRASALGMYLFTHVMLFVLFVRSVRKADDDDDDDDESYNYDLNMNMNMNSRGRSPAGVKSADFADFKGW